GAVLKHKHGPRAPRGHGTDGLHEVGRGIDRDELRAHDLFDGRQRRHQARFVSSVRLIPITSVKTPILGTGSPRRTASRGSPQSVGILGWTFGGVAPQMVRL